MVFRVNEEAKSLCFGSWHTLSSRGLVSDNGLSYSASYRLGWRRSTGWSSRVRTSKFNDYTRGSGTSLLMI